VGGMSRLSEGLSAFMLFVFTCFSGCGVAMMASEHHGCHIL
jgi:hypothetical protein